MSFRPDEPEKFRAWLSSVVRHAAATYWRKERRISQHEAAVLNERNTNGEERVESLVQPGSRDEFAAVELRLWMENLPEQERMVLVGLFIAQMTEAELAKRMGCSQARINQIKKRALKTLREQIVNGGNEAYKNGASKRLNK